MKALIPEPCLFVRERNNRVLVYAHQHFRWIHFELDRSEPSEHHALLDCLAVVFRWSGKIPKELRMELADSI